MYKSTKQHLNYWKTRKMDWRKDYTSTWNHPHRNLTAWMLKTMEWLSLWEVGMGGGANIVRFMKDPELARRQYGGCDPSPEAVAAAQEVLSGGLFHVETGKDMLLSDKSVDVILSDMALIYVDPFDIDAYIKEFKRVARNAIVFVEFHSPYWWKRQKQRFTDGYHIYNYYHLLEKHGFYDVMCQHIPEEFWPGTDSNTEFRTIITAKIPRV